MREDRTDGAGEGRGGCEEQGAQFEVERSTVVVGGVAVTESGDGEHEDGDGQGIEGDEAELEGCKHK